MRKHSTTLVLIVILLAIISSISLARGDVPKVNVIGVVDKVISGDSFSLESGCLIKLADISAPIEGKIGYNESMKLLLNIKNQTKIFSLEGQTVYLDVNLNECDSNKEFYAVAYLQLNDDYFINLNQYLVDQKSFIKTSNTLNGFNPYFWGDFLIPRSALQDNTLVNAEDFSSERLELLKSYSSQTLTHSTLLVTLTIAIPTALVALHTERINMSKRRQKVGVYIILTGLFSALLYDIFRLFYWSWMSSSVLGVLPSQSISTGADSLSSGIQEYLKNTFISQNFLGFVYDTELAIVLLIPIAMFLGLLGIQLMNDKCDTRVLTIRRELLLYIIIPTGILIAIFTILSYFFKFNFGFVTITLFYPVLVCFISYFIEVRASKNVKKIVYCY